MKRIPGWNYRYSKSLEMEYSWNDQTGEVYTEDRVKYKPKEIQALKGKQITKEIHMIKKEFKGEIIE